MSFNAIRENKILANISEFSVAVDVHAAYIQVDPCSPAQAQINCLTLIMNKYRGLGHAFWVFFRLWGKNKLCSDILNLRTFRVAQHAGKNIGPFIGLMQRIKHQFYQ